MLHVDPTAPGAYEWWYFDVLSDDGRWALVVIFFLGSPMSPYYRAVARGEEPDPREWCGVFLTLHENTDGVWRERAYAYNLYDGGTFPSLYPRLKIGESDLSWAETGKGSAWTWTVEVDERGLWRGRTQASLAFKAEAVPSAPPPIGDADDSADHTWVLVAPQCRTTGVLTLPDGERIHLRGTGYHDHNYGRLPFADTDLWYWGRVPLVCDDGATRTAVLYHLEGKGSNKTTRLFLFDVAGAPVALAEDASAALSRTIRGPYGLWHAARLEISAAKGEQRTHVTVTLPEERSGFAAAPFYRRLPINLTAWEQRSGRTVWSGTGDGVGDVFRPARLCGPIVSRAMWSRIRRRKTGCERNRA